MVILRKVQLLSIAVLALGLAVSCTSKKKSEGGSGGKEEEEEEPSGPAPGPSPGPSSPCLRLQTDTDSNSNTDTDTDSEMDMDMDTDSNSDSNTSSGSDTSSSTDSNVSDCGDSTGTDTGGGGGGGSYDVGPGIDGCKEQGAVWVAVKAVGDAKKGACGDPLADFCCTEENIYALFPNMESQLKPKFEGYKADGFKLYGCSTAGGKYAFHFGNGDTVAYKSAFVTNVTPKAGVTAPASCPAVTLDDMGFSKVDTNTDTDTDTTSTTDTSTNTDTTAIPAAIGALTDTTEEGLLTFLSSKAYQSWASKGSRNDSVATAGSIHADVDVKAYYNDKLKESDTAWIGTTKKHKVDSIAVLEIFSSKTTNAASKPKGWAVMAKAKNEEGKDSWLFAGVLGTAGTFPDFDSVDFKSRGMGVESCATCHEAAANQRDFVTTRAP